MEALVALGLTGTVVQFVRLTGELLSESIIIRKGGKLSSAPKLQNLATQLTKQAGLIITHLNAARAVEELAQEDQVSTRMLQTGRSYSSLIVLVPDRNCGRVQGSGTHIPRVPRHLARACSLFEHRTK